MSSHLKVSEKKAEMSGKTFYPFINFKMYHSSKGNFPLPESRVRFLVPTPQLIQVIVLLIIMSSSSRPKPHSGLSWVSNKGQGPLSEPVGHAMSMSGLS